MKKHLLKGLLPLWFCLLPLVGGFPSLASAQNLPLRIQIVVVEGDGITSNVRDRVGHDPVVRVEDDDHRPVVGAVVVFALPISGTSGEFPNGAKSLTVLTDDNGVAAAHGLKTNEIPGKLQIYVMASYRGLRARGTVNQFVEAPAGFKTPVSEVRTSKSGGKWKWVLLGIAAAGGAGAGVYFAQKGSNTATPVSISTGAVVFGSPH